MLGFRKRSGECEINTTVGSSSGVVMPYTPGQSSRFIEPDWGVLFCVFSLLLIGTLMVFSASISLSDSPKYKVTVDAFLNKHIISLGAAVIVAVFVSFFPMKFWERYSAPIFILGLLLLVAVLIPGIGKNVNGSYRWIQFGPFQLQVTEFVKVAALLYAARFTVVRQNWMHSFSKGFLPMGIVVGITGALVLMEPDLGALIMIVCISMGILFLGGINITIFIAIFAVLVGVFITVIVASPWRMARIFAYLDPWDQEHALGKAYQLSHSLIAFGRGEIFGVGLGDAIEKQNYLPEAHTDFILAIIGEELGFVGVIIVLGLFLCLVRKAFEIGRKAILLKRFFSGLVAQGVAIWFGVQVFINVGVASGLLPTKGLTLPFVSYGGSALMACLAAIALLLRVDYENKVTMRGGSV